MNYKVLYRKYRPTDFDNIVDQKYTVEILKNSIKTGKISHAYIFSGPRGTGKTTTAKVFAKSINCENNKNFGPCGECLSCKSFDNSPDIIEIDAASNNGVDEIRELINNIKLTPTYSKYKVYIIDEVHMLSQSAFNALLLTLEEPPEHVVFILATTNIESVPITILSRCQRFDFKKISDTQIVNRLRLISDKENIKITEEALQEIAYLSDGGMRDALSILDQLAANNSEINFESVVEHFGSISRKKINDLINFVERGETKKIISIIDDLRKCAVDYKQLIKKMLDVLRERALIIREDGDYNWLTYSEIKNLIFELIESLTKVNVNIDSFMLVELILLKYATCNNESIEEKQVEKEQKKEKVVISEEKRKLINEDNLIQQDIRINNCFVNAKKEFLTAVQENWQKFLDKNKSNKRIYSLIIDGSPVAASDTNFIIATTLVDTANLINQQIGKIESEYNKLFKQQYKIVAICDEDWKIEKAKYIANKKNNVKYNYIEENTPDDRDQLKDAVEKIFDTTKIEIK